MSFRDWIKWKLSRVDAAPVVVEVEAPKAVAVIESFRSESDDPGEIIKKCCQAMLDARFSTSKVKTREDALLLCEEIERQACRAMEEIDELGISTSCLRIVARSTMIPLRSTWSDFEAERAIRKMIADASLLVRFDK